MLLNACVLFRGPAENQSHLIDVFKWGLLLICVPLEGKKGAWKPVAWRLSPAHHSSQGN